MSKNNWQIDWNIFSKWIILLEVILFLYRWCLLFATATIGWKEAFQKCKLIRIWIIAELYMSKFHALCMDCMQRTQVQLMEKRSDMLTWAFLCWLIRVMKHFLVMLLPRLGQYLAYNDQSEKGTMNNFIKKKYDNLWIFAQRSNFCWKTAETGSKCI